MAMPPLKNMLGTTVLGLFYILGGSMGLSSEQLMIRTSLLSAQCKSRCLTRFSPSPKITTYNEHNLNYLLLECWNKCGAIYSDNDASRISCHQYGNCSQPCDEACRFYLSPINTIEGLDFSLTKITHLSKPLDVEYGRKFDKLEWGPSIMIKGSPYSLPSNGIVYTLFIFNSRSRLWGFLNQTLEFEYANEPSGLYKNGYMVVGVNETHVLTKDIFFPRSELNSLDLRQLNVVKSSDDLAMLKKVWESSHHSAKHELLPWNIKLHWLKPSEKLGLVEALITWNNMMSMDWEVPSYMITWEKFGVTDGIKSYLYTDQQQASLNLLPESVYYLRVEAFSSRYGIKKSPEIQIDTHGILLQDFSLGQSVTNQNGKNTETLWILLGASIFSFLTILILLLCLYRKRRLIRVQPSSTVSLANRSDLSHIPIFHLYSWPSCPSSGESTTSKSTNKDFSKNPIRILPVTRPPARIRLYDNACRELERVVF